MKSQWFATSPTVERMRNFFGELLCECESLDFVRLAMTTPDTTMEVSAHFVICVDCSVGFHVLEELPAESVDDGMQNPPPCQTSPQPLKRRSPASRGKERSVAMVQRTIA